MALPIAMATGKWSGFAGSPGFGCGSVFYPPHGSHRTGGCARRKGFGLGHLASMSFLVAALLFGRRGGGATRQFRGAGGGLAHGVVNGTGPLSGISLVQAAYWPAPK